jgi:hypothetical protein
VRGIFIVVAREMMEIKLKLQKIVRTNSSPFQQRPSSWPQAFYPVALRDQFQLYRSFVRVFGASGVGNLAFEFETQWSGNRSSH